MSVSEFSESMNFQNNYLRTIITATENSANSGIPNCLVQTMNGRIYDPTLARFLSPDPILQNPSYTQSHNRYSYCLNNPLKYTDPSGYNIHPIWIAGSNEIMNGTISIFARKGGWTPISGNYWSNNSLYRYNDNTLNSANFMLMNERTFINTYGKTEYWITYIGFTGGLTTLNSEEILEFFKSDEQKQKEREFNNKKALGRAGNIGYGLMAVGDLSGDPPSDIVEVIKEIWYFPIVRNVIPDLITLSLDLSYVPIYGVGGSWQLNLLTRGKEPGVFFTNAVSTRYGLEGDWGINLGWGYYQDNPANITRNSLTGLSYDVDGGYGFGVNIWGGVYDNTLIWAGAKAGWGCTIGASLGINNTYLGLKRPTWP